MSEEKVNDNIDGDPMSPYYTNKLNPIDDGEFDNIIKLQKEQGDMFPFGEILNLTPKIFKIIIKLYHENIVRLMSEINTSFKGAFMLGILETTDGQIYMAISEEPDEDPKFKEKISALSQMLRNSNINYEVPGDENEVDSFIQQAINYRPDPIDYSLPLNNIKIKDIKSKMLLNIEEESIKSEWDNELRLEEIEGVKLINSAAYLIERQKQLPVFTPFKKYDKRDKSGKRMYKCNNGSTCVESKLFSYIYSHNIPYADIKAYTAYRIGDNLPPHHYMAKYSYCDIDDGKKDGCMPSDIQKLKALCELVLSNPDNNFYLKYSIIYNEVNNSILKSILQPLALSCPGCFLNSHYNYQRNNRGYFDYTNCSSRHNTRLMLIEGGGNHIIFKKNRKSYKKPRKSNRKTRKSNRKTNRKARKSNRKSNRKQYL